VAIPARRSSSDLSLRQFLDQHYERWMTATHRGRAGQVRRIRSAFRDLLDANLADVTAGCLERWRATRRNRRGKEGKPSNARAVSPATVNRDMKALQAALSRAAEWGLVSANPLGRVKPMAEDKTGVIRYLSPKEEQRLRTALAARDETRQAARASANHWRRERGYDEWPEYGVYSDYLTPLVLLALNTGLRRGELLNLCWRDVDTGKKFVTVLGEGAKTGQTRYVPLNSEIVDVLTRWRPSDADPDSFLFTDANAASPLLEARAAWTRLIAKAGVSSFRFHDLRHTFASKLVMAGVDLNTVRELLGHRDIAMTLRYAHLAPEHKAAAVERLVRAR